MKIKKMVYAFGFGAMIILLAFGLASASLSLSGSIINQMVEPGQNISKEVTLKTSADDKASNYTIGVFGFGQTPSGGTADLIANEDMSPYSARTFLKVTPSSIHLEPGESGKILIEADIPKDVGTGCRYALVNIIGSPMAVKSGAGISLAFDIPIMLNISGTDIKKTGEITSLDFNKPFRLRPDLPEVVEAPRSAMQNITVVFKNTGNYHYRAQAMAELKDETGNILANATSSGGINSIIPTFSREFMLSLIPSMQLKPGTYFINTTVSNINDGTILASKEMKFDINS